MKEKDTSFKFLIWTKKLNLKTLNSMKTLFSGNGLTNKSWPLSPPHLFIMLALLIKLTRKLKFSIDLVISLPLKLLDTFFLMTENGQPFSEFPLQIKEKPSTDTSNFTSLKDKNNR